MTSHPHAASRSRWSPGNGSSSSYETYSGNLPRFLFELALDMKPNNERHVLEPREYEIELALAPRNADSSRWIGHLSWDSAAEDNQPRNVQHSVVKVEM